MTAMVPDKPCDGTPGLFAGYSTPAGVYDEAFAAAGAARPQWKQFVGLVEALGALELERHGDQARRLLYENGITYNAYGDPEDTPRPWSLDVLPMLIGAEEWQKLAAGLAQRARLLNEILLDLYGPRTLLSRGLLPAQLLFAHPGFVLAYHDVRPPGGCFLHYYVADLARSPDGSWWVMNDRTDAPLGVGYALENRIITSRLLPTVFRDCHVERLAPFFLAMKDTLRELASQHRENPRTVLLSQGPSNPNYFEDSYLARYLGYTLAEGGDLAVRENRMMLKTLGGLLPVDVVLRRISDQNCDPLEARGDTLLGVSGLTQVARAGNVAVVNSLGSSLVESPAFLAFLPALCRELLGEKLLLPSVATWWCGAAGPRQYVLANLGKLVVRSAFRRDRQEPITPEELDRKSAAELTEMIRSNPTRFVAQERVTRSTTPAWSAGNLQPAHVALRTYVGLSHGKYITMPGGLVRVSPSSERLDRSIAIGASSKDVWILADGPVHNISLLTPSDRPVELRRGGADLPSRVADNLFWLGRYVERAEDSARLLRPILVRLTSESEGESMPELRFLLYCLADRGQIEPGFVVEGIREQLPQIEDALAPAILNEKQAGSLRSTLAEMYRLASSVRDRISLDSWRIINRIEQELQLHVQRVDADLSDVLTMLNQMLLDLAAFGGLVMESVTRTQGWRFLDLGRRLERAQHTINLVKSLLTQQPEHQSSALEAILEVADSSMTYRSRYLGTLNETAVLDLLLTDETNPRSLAFQLAAIWTHVEQLPRERIQPLYGPEQRIAMSALTKIRTVDVGMLSGTRRGNDRSRLERALTNLDQQLPRLSALISHKYLVHAGLPRQLADGS